MILASLLMSTCLLITSRAYPGGVPDLACESMFPSGHEAEASTDVPPYFIQVPTSTYRPGETVKVSIFSRRGQYFSGIYVQARRVGCHVNDTEAVGVFTAIDPLLETHHCFGQVHTAVSHTSNIKKTGVTFYWTAPVIPGGHVVIKQLREHERGQASITSYFAHSARPVNIVPYLFVCLDKQGLYFCFSTLNSEATVVKDKSVFWTDLDAAPLVDLQDTDTPFCVSHTHMDDFQFDHSRREHEAKQSHLDTHHGDRGNGCVERTRPLALLTGSILILFWLNLTQYLWNMNIINVTFTLV